MSPEDFAKHFSVSRETLARLQTYHDLLVKWQKAVNLVSPKTIAEAWERHFVDSMQIAEIIEQGAVLADMGSGAGFPGLVLAIVRSDLKVHLIESDERKCEFLKNVSRETGAAVTVHNGRVENILPGLGATLLTARAFAPLDEIFRLTGWDGTEMLLLKGRDAQKEIDAALKNVSFAYDMKPAFNADGYILRITKS